MTLGRKDKRPVITVSLRDLTPDALRLKRSEVPKPPRTAKKDIVDEGNSRWRFDSRRKLIAYILYEYRRDEGRETPNIVNLWTSAEYDRGVVR